MTEVRSKGGEPDGARLLELARRELLDTLLPQLSGDARYRARLIANAMKIAGHELRQGASDSAAAAESLRRFIDAELPAAEGLSDGELLRVICAALRAGRLDGQQDLHAVLGQLTEARRAALS